MRLLLLDEMYPPALAENLRAKGCDVHAVLEVDGLPESSDQDLLAWAARQDRCIVTENVDDFARLARGPHAGLVLVRARRWPRTAAGPPRLETALLALLSSEPFATADAVVWL